MKALVRAVRATLASAFLSVCCASAGAEPPQPYVADGNTMVLYHFNESTGTVATDSSGNNRHAVYGTGLGIGVPGVSSSGVSYFEQAIQSGASLTKRAYWTHTGAGTNSFLYPQPNTSFTIEGWFKLTQSVFTNARALIAVQPTGSPQYDYMLMALPATDGRPNLVFRDMGHYRVQTTGGLTWDPNTWYHVAVVVQQGATSTTYKIYRTPAGATTSTLVASATAGGLLVPSTLTSDRVLSVSNFYGDSGNDFFPGSVDEFRYSNTARSPGTFNLTLGPSTAERILSETLAPNSETDHAMPLLGTWNTGEYGYLYTTDAVADDDCYSPRWQVQRIDAGAHILPAVGGPTPWYKPDAVQSGNRAWYAAMSRYYDASLPLLASRNLPFTVVCTTWENLLWGNPTSIEGSLRNITPWQNNPNVIDPATHQVLLNGAGQASVSPCGPISNWNTVGQMWASSVLMNRLQTLYPNPPRVFLASDNEAPSLNTNELATDEHYTSLTPARSTADNNDNHIFIGDRWIERYQALRQSWKAGLSTSWQNASRFIAYGNVGPQYMGRWGQWNHGGLHITGRVSPWPLAWEGGMLDNYLPASPPPGNSQTDFQVFSPQMEAMNVEFMRQQYMQLNPTFWFEVINWNSGDFSPPNPNDPTCAKKLCQPFMNSPIAYTPSRYAGMVQFNMWTLRPRVVRDYRIWTSKRVDSQPYFDALSTAVEKIYNNPTLQSFWRNSTLVANPARPHPYNFSFPTEYQSLPRMFMLTVNQNPSGTWVMSGATTSDPTNGNHSTELTVYCIARVRGQSPNRQWLLYAYAPRATTTQQLSSIVTIPGYTPTVTINATLGGSLWLVTESNGSVQQIP